MSEVQSTPSWPDWRSAKGAQHGMASIDLRLMAIRYGLKLGQVSAAILCRLLDGDADWRGLAVAVSSHRPAKMGAIHEAISALNQAHDFMIMNRNPYNGGEYASKYALTPHGHALCVQAIERAELGLKRIKEEAELPADPPVKG